MSPESGVILCYDVGGTRTKLGLFDPHASTVMQCRVIETPVNRTGAEILGMLIGAGHELLGETRRPACGVGFAVTGVVDSSAGRVAAMNHLPQLQELPIGPQLAQAFEAPVIMDNDARAYAVGEAVHGSGRGFSSVLCYTIGTGVGCSFVRGGEPLRSPGLLAGILGGHVTVDFNGPLCSCGNRGCVETYASAPAIKAALGDLWQRGVPSIIRELCGGNIHRLSPVVLFEAYQRKDPSASEVFDRFIRALGAGIVSAVHLLDPEVVVLGGGVIAADEPVLPAIRDYVARHAWTQPKGRIEFRRAALGNEAALYGLAVMVQARLNAAGATR